jgi:hypothetical protein
MSVTLMAQTAAIGVFRIRNPGARLLGARTAAGLFVHSAVMAVDRDGTVLWLGKVSSEPAPLMRAWRNGRDDRSR